MPRANKGEVWLVDLGLAAKVRPCLLLSRYPEDDELALFVIVPHTTALRGNRWEFHAHAPFLQSGAFHLQQIQPVSVPKLIRRLGVLSTVEFSNLKQALVRELEL
jgi:mRNA interferase MazF